MILSRAPLRLPLGGGGTDLPAYYREHGGYVLTAAIDKYVGVVANRPAIDPQVLVRYSQAEAVSHASEVQHDLVRPALLHFGITERIELASIADVSAGTGLGSSGSYLVALLAALKAIKGEAIDRSEIAELACHIEIDLAGHTVGKQDQYAASLGGILSMEIDCEGHVTAERLPLDPAVVGDLQRRTLLFYTGVTRSAQEVLRLQSDDLATAQVSAVEAMHQTKTIGLAIRDSLIDADLDEFGRLLHEHWLTKKRRSSTVSLPAIDDWYEQGRAAGALGGKLVGAGGGGFLMLFVPEGAQAAVTRVMEEAGLPLLPFAFDFDGVTVLYDWSANER